jgi:saccharopine dehydrogenase-like NADP-dependent oxidoreductase
VNRRAAIEHQHSMKKRVVVLGGYGTFGSRISRALAGDELVDCVVAGRTRQRGEAFAREIGAAFREVNVHNPESLRAAVDGAYAVINACGPFQNGHYEIPKQCIQLGAHYVDLADARGYVDGITRLNDAARRADVLVVSGASTVPAVSSVLVDTLAREFSAIEEIHIALSPGNRNPRGEATVRSILSCVGQPLKLWRKGHWHAAHGWGEPETIRFAAPVGRRRVYLCDVPDLDLFPAHYGARTVTFRAGLQLNLFNSGLAVLGWLKRRGWVEDLPRRARLLIALSNLFSGAGDATGAIRVQVRGRTGRTETEHVIELVARDDNGPAIPCGPAIALIRKWVRGGVPATGAVACVGLLTLDDIRAVLQPCDIVLVRT